MINKKRMCERYYKMLKIGRKVKPFDIVEGLFFEDLYVAPDDVKADIPEGLHVYWLQHASDHCSMPVRVRDSPFFINALGTLITKDALTPEKLSKLNIPLIHGPEVLDACFELEVELEDGDMQTVYTENFFGEYDEFDCCSLAAFANS